MSVKEITTGQDSFLDIVANLVGVLIILVVVVGAQAKESWQVETPLPAADIELEPINEQLQASEYRAEKLMLDNQALKSQIESQISITQELDSARHQMLVQIAIVKEQLEQKQQEKLEKLSEQARRAIQLQAQERKLIQDLAQIEASMAAVEHSAAPKSEVIEHFPNPIAKTVFSQEIHFQVRKGLIAYVPLDELLSRMKSEWKEQAEQLRETQSIVETVGPIQNFRLQYELMAETIPQPGAPGGGRVMIQFQGFQLFPATEALGTPVAEAMQNQAGVESEFANILRRYPAGKTTVSLWVYPDSFPEYNQLKTWLYENGYQVACWPLEADKFISGGPSGFRTTAQ